MTWIETFHGHRFDLLDPKPEQVDIRDMAHALARQNRFIGHTTGDGYSVAEHSLWVWHVVSGLCPIDFLTQLWALVHDGHEAYTGDISGPLKMAFRVLALLDGRDVAAPVTALDIIEGRIDAAIYQALDVMPPPASQKAIIKEVDRRMLATEHLHFQPNTKHVPWGPDVSAEPYTDLKMDVPGSRTHRFGVDQGSVNLWAFMFQHTLKGLLMKLEGK